MLRYRRRALRFLWILLVVALVVGAWQLSSLLRISTFDVRATVKAPQAGITQVAASGGGSSASTANKTGSTSGTAPLTGNAGSGNVPQGIGITGATPPNNGGSFEPAMVQIGGGGGGGEKGTLLYINTDIDYGTVFPGEELTGYFTVYLAGEAESVSYNITMQTAGGEDMRPYLVVEKDSESDTEPDPLADGPSSDYTASGNLTSEDDSDKWWVTFYVPDETGDYNSSIKVETSDNITVNN